MRALIAVDGSAAAEQAAVVADQVLPERAEMLLLDVVETPAPALLGADGTGVLYAGQVLEEIERRALARAGSDVGEVADRLVHDADAMVDHGAVAERILTAAAERDVDLVVLGTTDRTWWDRLWDGSVSRRVASEAPCSVLVVRTAAPVRRVLVAVDDAEPATQAARLAGLLRLDDAETTVVTVVSRDAGAPVAGGPGPAEAHELVADVGARIGADVVAVEVDDDAVDALLAAAEQHRADLVVVGTGDRGALSRLFDGSVSRSVLDRAPCSVLVARTPSPPPGAATHDNGQEDR